MLPACPGSRLLRRLPRAQLCGGANRAAEQLFGGHHCQYRHDPLMPGWTLREPPPAFTPARLS